MDLFPVFLKLEGRRVLIVGGGNVGLEKITSLSTSGAHLRVITPRAIEAVQQLALQGKLTWEPRAFNDNDVTTADLVIAATDDPAVNTTVFQAARRHHILCNSADDPPNCDFYFPSIVRRGPLQIAISTAGESPAMAQQLRREIDAALPTDLGPSLTALGHLRRDVIAAYPPGEDRKKLLHTLASRPVCESPVCPTRAIAFPSSAAASSMSTSTPVSRTTAEKGRVYLVGAGPGDPELLTLRAARLLESADAVLHDDLVPSSILALASPAALVISVGKRCGVKRITQAQIHTLMIEMARKGLSVVRLKSGDPLVFGRAAEEIDALNEARVPFDVVPGVTSAFAAAAALRVSLTDRRASSGVAFSTAHHSSPALFPALQPDTTQVIYMPGRSLKALAEQWLNHSADPNLPIAIVSRAAQPDQHVQHTTLAALHLADATASPSLLLAGWALAQPAAQALSPVPELPAVESTVSGPVARPDESPA
jgi:uroporphyrin-III C-methyltransferase/precorrin-2 dehydrogenase/sirohydrochlorin ferrochelatase